MLAPHFPLSHIQITNSFIFSRFTFSFTHFHSHSHCNPVHCCPLSSFLLVLRRLVLLTPYLLWSHCSHLLVPGVALSPSLLPVSWCSPPTDLRLPVPASHYSVNGTPYFKEFRIIGFLCVWLLSRCLVIRVGMWVCWLCGYVDG